MDESTRAWPKAHPVCGTHLDNPHPEIGMVGEQDTMYSMIHENRSTKWAQIHDVFLFPRKKSTPTRTCIPSPAGADFCVPVRLLALAPTWLACGRVGRLVIGGWSAFRPLRPLRPLRRPMVCEARHRQTSSAVTAVVQPTSDQTTSTNLLRAHATYQTRCAAPRPVPSW